MSNNNRVERLQYLQDLVINTYIDALESGDINYRDLAPVVSLLNQNSIVETKTKSSIEEEIEQRLKEAEERRRRNANS